MVRRSSNGEPLAGVSLDFRVGRSLIVNSTTDARGQYDVALVPGVYEVRARLRAKGIERVIQDAFTVFGEKENTLDVALPVGPAVSGTILTWDGKPLTDVLLEIDDKGGALIAEKVSFKPDARGEFRILLERAAGVSNLFASAEGYPRSAPHSKEFLRDRDIEGVRITLDMGAGLEGQVLNDVEEPVPNARVVLETAVASYRPEARADQHGRFRFPALRSGDYGVLVEATGYMRARPAVRIMLAPGDLKRDLVIRIAPGWKIGGRVVDSGGLPVARCSIQVREAGVVYPGQTNAQGVFLVAGITPGEDAPDDRNRFRGIDSVTCLPKDLAPTTVQDATPGDHLNFVLSVGGFLEVRISLSDGNVPKHLPWTVSLRMTESPGKAARPDDSIYLRNGEGERSVLPNLAPGFYTVQVNAPGRTSVTFEMVVIRPGEVTPVETMLVAGQADASSFSFTMNRTTNPEQFRIHLAALLDSVDQEEGRQYLEEFLEDTIEFPALRKIVEEFVKKRP